MIQYGEELLTQIPRKYVQQTDKIDWQSELKIFKNKPRAIEHATYLKALPVKVKEYLLSDNLSTRRERIKILLTLLTDYSITEINTAISTGLNTNRTSLSDIKAILYRSEERRVGKECKY